MHFIWNGDSYGIEMLVKKNKGKLLVGLDTLYPRRQDILRD